MVLSKNSINTIYQGYQKKHAFHLWSYIFGVPLLAIFIFFGSQFKISYLLWSAVITYVFLTGGIVGYHRFIGHNSFKTSRFFGFLLCLWGIPSWDQGPLHFASWHRLHHKYEDTESDPQYNPNRPFWYRLFGWYNLKNQMHCINWEIIKDLQNKQELLFLTRFFHDWRTWGFLLSILLLGVTHATWFFILPCYLSSWLHLLNGYPGHLHLKWFDGIHSHGGLAHKGRATNNALRAMITLGDGWHGSHHANASSAFHGYKWYHIDISFYIIWIFSKVGLVWDVKTHFFTTKARLSLCQPNLTAAKCQRSL